jgi:hypothetical protein
VYCLCVNVYCHRVTTQLQLINIYHIIYHISYHTISYHSVPYHIISYHIISYIISYHTVPYYIITSYHISYHFMSCHISCRILSYRIISYHIISYFKFRKNNSDYVPAKHSPAGLYGGHSVCNLRRTEFSYVICIKFGLLRLVVAQVFSRGGL